MVECPICDKPVKQNDINDHIDSGCETHVERSSQDISATQPLTPGTQKSANGLSQFFQRGSTTTTHARAADETPSPSTHPPPPPTSRSDNTSSQSARDHPSHVTLSTTASSLKRPLSPPPDHGRSPPAPKRSKLSHAPLAERMRPRTLSDISGQPLLAPGGLLGIMLKSSWIPSLILWGSPGSGKTSIARLIASSVQPSARFIELTATATSVVELKKIFADAAGELKLTRRRTIVFCDEIHRFSKSQQDVFLRPVEDGTIILIGATTENPSFRVIGALLSRCRVLTLEPLGEEDVERILRRAIEMECPSGPPTVVDESLVNYLARVSTGDARTALNMLEIALEVARADETVTVDELKTHLRVTLSHDRAGDGHYTLISAFHKSVRGCSADGALYYLARMIEGGEDPLFIARRMIVIASEDVGLASESMLPLAVATYTACEKIGMPECRINLAHCATALALSKKSVRSYRAYNEAVKAVKEDGGDTDTKPGACRGTEVPWHLRNAPTRLLKEMGVGKEYKYNPDYEDGQVSQEYLPEALRGKKFLGVLDLGTQLDEELVNIRGDTTIENGQVHKDTIADEADEADNEDEQSKDPGDGVLVDEEDYSRDPLRDSLTPMDRKDKGTQSSPTIAGDSIGKDVAQAVESPIEIDDWEQ